MNLQQLEYILAINQFQSFTKAAEHCNVTQATLSMMVKKLEEELEIIIFDRSKQPIITTELGKKIIDQSVKILGETQNLYQLASSEKKELSGNFRLGIIPTIAPYLLPKILRKFQKNYPKVTLYVNEFTTDQIIEKLKSNQIDAGLLATPLLENTIKEYPLYYEKYMVYANKEDSINQKEYILPDDIEIQKLWLLEEGHCMRNQILHLCELKRKESSLSQLHYEASSISTLIQLVDHHYGMTIIPELAVAELNQHQKGQVRAFADPSPVREISLVTHYHYVKEKFVQSLAKVIKDEIPKTMQEPPIESKQILGI